MSANRGKTNSYTLGAGKVEFNLFPNEDETKAQGFRYLGSTSEFNLTQESETLEHKNSEGGMIYTDEEIAISTTLSGTLTTDNIVPENLALFYMGENSNVVQKAETGKKSILKLYAGNGYQLGATDKNPNGDFAVTVQKIELFADETTAKSGTGATGTLDVDVDYEIDSENGYLMIDYKTEKIKAEGAYAVVTYDTKDAMRDVVISKSKSIVGALRFRADNGTGANRTYFIPKVRLTPNGDHALKGEEWQTLSFNVKAVKKNDETVLLYINGVATVS